MYNLQYILSYLPKFIMVYVVEITRLYLSLVTYIHGASKGIKKREIRVFQA